MNLEELKEIEEFLNKEVSIRRNLGGYSADADGIRKLYEAVHKMCNHLIDTYPKKK